jgi:hypothetical protein
LLLTTNRLSEAEPLCQRALAIDEASYGPDHSKVARDLNHLALCLWDTDRLSEAEQVFRRSLVILTRFTLTTGHQHTELEASRSNYTRLLREIGRTDAEIDTALASIGEEAAREPSS